MKETADIFYHDNFSQVDKRQKRKINTLSLLILKKLLFPFKQELITALATLWIGSIFLFSIYLFFTQLAAYGW